MGKKVGIITFHNADNLGAVLQAFSLQQTLERHCGVQAQVVDYKCPMIESTKHIQKPTSLKGALKSIFLWGYYLIKRRGFSKFRKKKLVCSSCSYTPQTIGQCAAEYDILITGSDQVFNPGCSGRDTAYFLDFAAPSVKKLSYAASIGTYCFKDEEAPKIKGLLQDYQGLSVREESAAAELNRIGVEGAMVHPDPVILTTADQWKQHMSKRVCKEKYVLVYMVLPDVNVTRQAEEYAKKHGYKVINNKKSLEFIFHNSPAEFLSWIYYAECVFTNSFHGTAFSTVFNKPLQADIQLVDGGVNNRVNDFLARINAAQCIMEKGNLQVFTPNGQQALEEMRQKGLEYLKVHCQ